MKGFLKTIMILIVLGVIGGVLYLFVFDSQNPFAQSGGGQETDGLSFDNGAGDAFGNTGKTNEELEIEIDTASVVSMFNGVSAIKLDGSIMTSLGFRNLLDFSVPITIPQNSGRSNPFLPIGVNQASSTGSRGVSLTGVSAVEEVVATQEEEDQVLENPNEEGSLDVEPVSDSSSTESSSEAGM